MSSHGYKVIGMIEIRRMNKKRTEGTGDTGWNEPNDWYILMFIFLYERTFFFFFSDDVHNKLWVNERWVYPGQRLMVISFTTI